MRLISRRGAVWARARLSPGIVPGTVFLPFHFAEAAANELAIGALDPVARIPEYKACAVRLEAADRKETEEAPCSRRSVIRAVPHSPVGDRGDIATHGDPSGSTERNLDT